MPNRTDMELLAAWRAGQASAGEALFERYFAPLSRFFVNKVPMDHEDLIQETFTACVSGRDRLRSDASFRSYLFSTAYNVLKNYYNRNRARDEDVESHAAIDLAPGPSTLLRADDQSLLLLQALRSIPLELQVVMEMRYWEEMSSAEIGEALGIAPNTVRTRTFRGREKLVEAMARLTKDRGDSSSSIIDLDAWAQHMRAQLHEGSDDDTA